MDDFHQFLLHHRIADLATSAIPPHHSVRDPAAQGFSGDVFPPDDFADPELLGLLDQILFLGLAELPVGSSLLSVADWGVVAHVLGIVRAFA